MHCQVVRTVHFLRACYFFSEIVYLSQIMHRKCSLTPVKQEPNRHEMSNSPSMFRKHVQSVRKFERRELDD